MRWGPVSIVVRGCLGTIKINCCSVFLPETRSEMKSVFNWRLFVVTFLHIEGFIYCAASLVEELQLQVLNSQKLEQVCFRSELTTKALWPFLTEDICKTMTIMLFAIAVSIGQGGWQRCFCEPIKDTVSFWWHRVGTYHIPLINQQKKVPRTNLWNH